MEPSFKDFMLKEYDQIANAHFNMVQNISTFFRHYLVIMAIPVALLSLASKADVSDITTKVGENSFYLAASAVFVILSILGLCVCMYVMNLRFDAILYARTVNGMSVAEKTDGKSRDI